MSLPEAFEAAATAIDAHADAIRTANGDPVRLLELLDEAAGAQVLAWLLEQRPADGDELAAEWAAEEGGEAPLLAVDEAALGAPARKLLRRVRHRLRSRGVAVQEQKPRPVVAALPAIEDDFRRAYLSGVDPAGVRIAYVAEPNPSGGVRIFEVVLDEGRGIGGFEVYSAPRKRARRFLDDLHGRDNFPLVEVELEQVQAVVAFAEAHQAADRPPPRSFAQYRSRLARPAPERLPGSLVRAELGDGETADRPEALLRATELVKSGRVGPWPPDGKVLQSIFERIRSTEDDPLIVSPAARSERIEGILDEEAAELFDAQGTALVAHRLREQAFVLMKYADEGAARACLAAAVAFEAGEVSGNPVARAMLEVPLAPALRALDADREAEKPGGAAEPSGDEPLIQPARS